MPPKPNTGARIAKKDVVTVKGKDGTRYKVVLTIAQFSMDGRKWCVDMSMCRLRLEDFRNLKAARGAFLSVASQSHDLVKHTRTERSPLQPGHLKHYLCQLHAGRSKRSGGPCSLNFSGPSI